MRTYRAHNWSDRGSGYGSSAKRKKFRGGRLTLLVLGLYWKRRGVGFYRNASTARHEARALSRLGCGPAPGPARTGLLHESCVMSHV